MIKSRLSVRLGALLMLLVMLFTLLPLAVSAEDPSAASVEPMLLRADDYTEAVTGFHLFADNPDNLPLQISYAIYKASDTTAPIAVPDGWVAVAAMEQTEAADDAAQTARPVFAVSFHKPTDITVEDPAYIESPECLRAVSVSGSPVYTLAPGYMAAFRIVGGTADEDGTYPLDHTLTWQSELPVVTFDLDRPAKIITQLTQQDGEHGKLEINVLNSDAIRYLYKQLAAEDSRTAFLAEYGLTDAQLYIQYDQTRMDVPSVYDAEADDGLTEVWSPETLEPIITASDQNLGFNTSHLHTFDEEAFRAFFPEETFTEATVDDGDDASEDPTVWVIDTETVSLSIRARYVFALTTPDGTVYYIKSAFTDPFYCGASNSLVSDPTALDAPVLSDPRFETQEDGSVLLSYQVQTNPSVRDTAFWCITYRHEKVGYEIELSINGSEWVTFDSGIEGTLLLHEDIGISLPVSGELLSEYAYIRVRMRYIVPDLSLQSEWSAALAFDIKPAEIVTAPVTEHTVPLYTESTGGDGELKYVCPICGFCPAPYGVCLFLWLGAALLIVLLIVLVIALIPKKKYCPRCSAACKPQDKSCTTCGYRFVGSMPEIEDTTGEITLPKQTTAEEEDAFYDDAIRDGQRAPRVMAVNLPDDDDEAPDTVTPAKSAPAPAPAKESPKPAAAAAPKPAAAPTAAPNAAFLVELKRKMAAVKSGQKVSFTPEEIAYIKALKDKAAPAQTAAPTPATTAAPKPAAAPTAASDANSDTREIPVAPIKVTPPAAEDSETAARDAQLAREAQIARLRALRAKQLSAEDTAELEKTEKKAETPAQPRRVEKPAKQIKCPACAVPNPETSGQCYICGTRLK